jgi:D-hydroxyproline dehydrogenase subunit beta
MLSPSLPAAAEYQTPGTLWVAADGEELAEAARKQRWLAARNVSAQLLSARELAVLEPNLCAGLAGALLVRQDAIVDPPVVALHLAREAQSLGASIVLGSAVERIADGEAVLGNGARLHAPRLLNALGAESARLTPGIPVRKRKGHLAVTDRCPGFVRHQLVELGYLKSAHSVSTDSIAFNVQPRKSGQVLIGSSRQYGNEDSAVDQAVLDVMLQRAAVYLPNLASLHVIGVRAGFRAATPDKLPLIGPLPGDPSLWLATGHEGLGITTAPATAELIAAHFTGAQSAIPAEPYLPSRFAAAAVQQESAGAQP